MTPHSLHFHLHCYESLTESWDRLLGWNKMSGTSVEVAQQGGRQRWINVKLGRHIPLYYSAYI